jgi:hypothetical protein
MNATLATDPVNGNDMRVVQLGCRRRFQLESLKAPFVQCGREWQDLQRDAAVQRLLDRLINDAHAAPTDFSKETKVAQMS